MCYNSTEKKIKKTIDPIKKPRGRPRITNDRICSKCGEIKSTEWRRGPNNLYLCNSCGLSFGKIKKHLSTKKNNIRFLCCDDPESIINSAFLNNHFHLTSLYINLIDGMFGK